MVFACFVLCYIIWNNLRPFGIFYGHLIKVCGGLVFFPVLVHMFYEEKIWQPC
jgi:hypothetical protein